MVIDERFFEGYVPQAGVDLSAGVILPDGDYILAKNSHLKTLVEQMNMPEDRVWELIPKQDSPLFWLIARTGCVITDGSCSVGLARTPQQQRTYDALLAHGVISDKYYDITEERRKARRIVESCEEQEEEPKSPEQPTGRHRRAVVSLGHDALGVTTASQQDAVRVTAAALADLIQDDYDLVITHGNGPQVSMIHKAMTELRRIYIDYTPAPMCVCSAMSQGYVGFDIQNALRSELISRGVDKSVSTVLTQVTVDPYDEAFYNPTKRIGRVMSAEDADTERAKGNYVTQVENGYMRVVAAPRPIDIVEIDTIRALADAGQVVIACGGGGIPVIEQGSALKGASAVIEKDAAAALLAQSLASDCLIILTSVDAVYTGFGSDDARAIPRMTVAEAEAYIAAGEFEDDTMLPKIEAAISYLSHVPAGEVLITSIASIDAALDGQAGTLITAA